MAKMPIIILAGQAGSGKDTVAQHLAQHYNAACVAQADPMKRFARDVFGFSEEALWGPSAMRNAVDESTVTRRHDIETRFYACFETRNEMLNEVVPHDRLIPARAALKIWFDGLYVTLCQDIPVSPRLVLQTVGTEWGRLVSADMWSLYAIHTAEQLVRGGVKYSRGEGLTVADHPGYDYGVITDGRFRNEILNVSKNNGASFRIDRPGTSAAGPAGGVVGHASEKLNIPDHFCSTIIENHRTLDHLFDEVDQRMSLAFSDERAWDLQVGRHGRAS
jgi:hypothetical protein